MAITYERWQRAQVAEAKHHNETKEQLIKHYKDSYRQYFDFVELETDLKDKSIIEVGCAHIPALYFCENYEGVIIEPLPSEILKGLAKEMNIEVVQEPAENVLLTETYDECWLFNVLQHVIDPNELIENMKASANTIRYFEPVETEISENHPHSFTIDDFKRWFGNPKLYEPKGKIVNFHTNKAAYGVYDHV